MGRGRGEGAGGEKGKERFKEGDGEEEVQEVGKRRAPLEESRTTARARLRVGLITKHN